MDTNTEKAVDIITLVIDSVSLLISFPGCIFILVVNILDWQKNRRLDISDQLISGLGLTNLINVLFHVGFRCTILMHGIDAFNNSVMLSINLFYCSLNLCPLLFSMWLSIHFCLKIVTINHNLYIYIQRMFPKIFPWILLPSVLVTILISSPAAQDLSRLYFNSRTSLNTSSSSLNTFHSMKLYFAFSSICYLIFLTLVLVTIVSLYRHVHRMQNNAVNFRSETVEAHVNAVKTLIFLLCQNLLHFILPISIMLQTNDWQWVVLLYAICHILDLPVLIRGSRKLQKKLQKLSCISVD